MPTVTFLPSNVKINVDPGETVLRAAMFAGVHINASCGGQGVCGKCRVHVDEGRVEGGRGKFINDDDFTAGFRLACSSQVVGDLVVAIPIESQMDKRVQEATGRRVGAAKLATQLDLATLKAEGKFEPPFEKLFLQLDKPTLDDNVSDLDRLIRALKHTGYDRLSVDYHLLDLLPNAVRDQDFNVTVTVARSRTKQDKVNLFNVEAGDTRNIHLAVCIDIGTTTVSAELLDLNTGDVLAHEAEYNNQVSYGEDVISRIMYSQKSGGLDKLQEKVIGNINSLMDKLLESSGKKRKDISHLSIAANTTMVQLLLGINPQFLRMEPYTPAMTYVPPVRASHLGINVSPQVAAYVSPCRASYVGGDVLVGVMGSGFYREEPITLYIDLGTNGEIVIGNKDFMVCAAASAGPAFEGGGVKYGMRATAGAIEDFSIDPVTFEKMILTIDQGKPKGVCGSGLINIVAALLEDGLIDHSGKFNREAGCPWIREGEDGGEFLLVPAEDADVDRDIVLTEIDVDNLMRAKGAMFAAYMTLLESIGLSITDIKRVIIAGNFGNYINIDKAILIGLLPELKTERFHFIGNGSLLGAKLISYSNQLRTEMMGITQKMTNFELSVHPGFMDYYVAALFFPHTDPKIFPRVYDLLDRTWSEVREARLQKVAS
ncbi:MAG: DUF4445 domain-containing protein [Proteobacteria bacterium]|nr:DUF4445 domain-containing protein [Pseudomonadota bacterium]MBU1743135.1 DUF4445 domain-containing protein [Pseudomonadota bacterium]